MEQRRSRRCWRWPRSAMASTDSRARWTLSARRTRWRFRRACGGSTRSTSAVSRRSSASAISSSASPAERPAQQPRRPVAPSRPTRPPTADRPLRLRRMAKENHQSVCVSLSTLDRRDIESSFATGKDTGSFPETLLFSKTQREELEYLSTAVLLPGRAAPLGRVAGPL